MKAQITKKSLSQTTRKSLIEKHIQAEVLHAYEKSKYGPWYGPFTTDEFKVFIKEREKSRRKNLK